MADTVDFESYFKQRIYSINHPGMSQNEMVDGYKNWTHSYEQDLSARDYSAPKNAALAVSQRFPENVRATVRILDIGAGTGLVGEKLVQHGFVYMDALEPIKEMLDVARKKNIYQNCYEEFLSATKPTSIPNDTYNCITAAGCFHENHIACEVIPELIRIVKPDGCIVISTKSADSDYYTQLDKFINTLVQDGKLSHVDRTKSVFFIGSDSITYTLTVS